MVVVSEMVVREVVVEVGVAFFERGGGGGGGERGCCGVGRGCGGHGGWRWS